MVINGIPSAKAAGHADCSADYPLAQTGKPGFKPMDCNIKNITAIAVIQEENTVVLTVFCGYEQKRCVIL